MDEFHCVLRRRDGADLTNIPEIQEARLSQFCNMQSKMQTGIKFLHFHTHEHSKSLKTIELLVQRGRDQ